MSSEALGLQKSQASVQAGAKSVCGPGTLSHLPVVFRLVAGERDQLIRAFQPTPARL